jgi:hypothetical protein
MNDFSELEDELRKLRPAQPSPVLFERVGEALSDCRASAAADARWTWWRLRRPSYNWWSLGFGVAAAAIMILFAVIRLEREHKPDTTVAQSSPAPEMRPEARGTEQSPVTSRFVPAGGTNVVYNARDEGLHFADGAERPVRRVRYQTQQTWRWRNPETGASLRVSYPSEEIVLIPVSGQ